MRLLLDANLAILLVVGLAAPQAIARHKRLQEYTIRDFEDVKAYVDQFDVVFLPNTLTEISNLAVQGVADPLRTQIRMIVKNLIETCEERYAASIAAAQRPEFLRLGLTDAALLQTCGPDVELFTNDDGLFYAASRSGSRARSLSHIRAER